MIAIIGILAAIAIPQFNQYKARAYDSASKTALSHLYWACKAYWSNNGSDQSCTKADASGANYGFSDFPGVTASSSGNEADWSATAKHTSTNTTFEMAANGYLMGADVVVDYLHPGLAKIIELLAIAELIDFLKKLMD